MSSDLPGRYKSERMTLSARAPRGFSFSTLPALLRRVSDHATHNYDDPALPPRLCENCQTPLRGPYCSACGQHDFDVHRSFRHVFHEALESFFHFDGKFFSGVVDLLFHPGRLTVNFNAGKRASQVPPLRFYVFVSLLFFVWLSFTRDAGNAINLDERPSAAPGLTIGRSADKNHPADSPTPAEPVAQSPNVSEGSSTPAPAETSAKADPAAPGWAQLLAEETAKAKARKEAGTEIIADGIDYDRELGKWVWREKPGTKDKSELGRWVVEKLNHRREIGETFVHFVPKMLLLCLPLFALFTRVLFRRAGLVYLQHLILALHLHTFVYLYWMFADGWSRLAGLASTGLGEALAAISLLYAFIYFFFALKRVFRESGARTFFKGGLLFFGYWLTLALASLVTIGIALFLV